MCGESKKVFVLSLVLCKFVFAHGVQILGVAFNMPYSLFVVLITNEDSNVVV